jgi:hypothetical protein
MAAMDYFNQEPCHARLKPITPPDMIGLETIVSHRRRQSRDCEEAHHRLRPWNGHVWRLPMVRDHDVNAIQNEGRF